MPEPNPQPSGESPGGGTAKRVISMLQVAEIAYGVGFRGDKLAIAVAVAKAESGLAVNAVGDGHLADGKWGPSIGLWQIRSLHVDSGTGRTRDAKRLFDPVFNARSAYAISNGGNDFSPWSVFKSRIYSRYLAAARRAVKVVSGQAGSGGSLDGGSGRPGGAGAYPTPSGSSGSVSGGGGTFSPLPEIETPDVIIPAGALSLRYKPPRDLDSLYLRGVFTSSGDRNIGQYVIGGNVDLTTGMASEVRLDLNNPDLTMFGDGRAELRYGAQLWWDGLRMQVGAVELNDKSGPAVTVTCRSLGAERLKSRHDVFHAEIAAKGAQNVSATEYVQQQVSYVAKSVLEFMGQGTSKRSNIAPAEAANGGLETPWDTIRRLAEEEGFLLFEAADVVYFGRPSWLVQYGVEVKVGWRNSWGDERLDAVGLPVIRKNSLGDPATLTCKLPRWRGEMLHPGMRLALKGIYGVPQIWLVTGVSWPIDGGVQDVTVEAVEPIDNMVAGEPKDKDTEPTAATSPTPAGSSSASSNASLAWGGHRNGRIPLSALREFKVDGVTHRLETNAAVAFLLMRGAARRAGVYITLTDSYRDYAAQVRVKADKGNLAATPGRSNHGWGKAIDVDQGKEWIQRNGELYGWVWPTWARPGGSKPEDWHYEFRPKGRK